MLAHTSASPQVELGFHPHVSVWLVVGAVAVFYWWAFTRLGPRLVGPGNTVSTSRQRGWIIAAILLTWIFAEWPIHDIAERYLFLVHMTQHTFFTFVTPAMFLLGTPEWLWRWMFDGRPWRRLVHFLSHPFVALITFNTLVAVTHWPAVVERSLHSELLHFSLHLTIFTSALLMWVPVINRVKGYRTLSDPLKMVYLLGQSVLPTVPAAFLTFSKTPLYKTYGAAPRIIKSMSAVSDQQLAAAVMKIVGGAFLWSVVGFIFMHWWKESQAGRVSDNRLPAEAVSGRPKPVLAGVSLAGSAAVGTSVAHGDDGEVLTWEQVRAELDRLEGTSPSPG